MTEHFRHAMKTYLSHHCLGWWISCGDPEHWLSRPQPANFHMWGQNKTSGEPEKSVNTLWKLYPMYETIPVNVFQCQA